MSALQALLACALAAAAAAASAPAAQPVVEQDLTTAGGWCAWVLTNGNGSLSVPATVPGAAHTDLLAAGRVGEPYAALEADAQRWVMGEAWAFTCDFRPSPALAAR